MNKNEEDRKKKKNPNREKSIKSNNSNGNFSTSDGPCSKLRGSYKKKRKGKRRIRYTVRTASTVYRKIFFFRFVGEKPLLYIHPATIEQKIKDEGKGKEKKEKRPSQLHRQAFKRKWIFVCCTWGDEERTRVCQDVTEKERDLAMLLHEPSITEIQSPSRQTSERRRRVGKKNSNDTHNRFADIAHGCGTFSFRRNIKVFAVHTHTHQSQCLAILIQLF